MSTMLVVIVHGLVKFREEFDQINIVINDVWHTRYFPILFLYLFCVQYLFDRLHVFLII